MDLRFLLGITIIALNRRFLNFLPIGIGRYRDLLLIFNSNSRYKNRVSFGAQVGETFFGVVLQSLNYSIPFPRY